jgi:metal-responsive CopG/Arc/MetJ family transcriptional regulator
MAKVMISIDDELLERINEMAKKLYTNRSAYIAMTMAQVLQNQEEAMGIIRQVTEKAIEDNKAKK